MLAEIWVLNEEIDVMKKRKLSIIALGIIVVISITGCQAANSNTISKNNNTSNVTQSEEVKSANVNVNKMIDAITALCANSRQFGSDNEKKACENLKNVFISYGYKPQIQKFNDEISSKKSDHPEKILSQNLIAVKKNTAKVSKGVIIICAHYDCEENSSGANDNASGVAVVLETARLLKNLPSNYELRFILFSGEEYHCRGSLYYVNNLSNDDKKNITAVINIDSIAQKNYENPHIFTISGKENTATSLLKSASENKTLSVNKTKLEGSDYFIFDHFGIPALLICQPYTSNLKVNSPEDTISLVDKEKLKYVANMIIRALVH